jgi:ankyrin repeat protein
LLLDAGLNIDQQGDMGNTALHYAKKFKHKDVVNILIDRGASTDIKNEFNK